MSLYRAPAALLFFPPPPSLHEEVTDAAYDALTVAPTRAGLVRCPAYVEDAYAPKRDHAATCAALRAETPEAR
jgi:hypothetical protein